MKVLLSFAPMAFASLSVTQPQLFDAAHMKETFKAISSQGGEIDDATKANVQSIIDLIKSNLTAALGVDFALINTEFKEAEDALEDCNTKMQTCADDEYSPAQGHHVDTATKHQNCRAYEHTRCKYEEDDCDKIDNFVKTNGAFFQPFPGVDADDDCAAEHGPINTWMNHALAASKRLGPGCQADDTGAACFARTNAHATLGQKGCSAADRALTCEDQVNNTHCECCDYASCRANCLTSKAFHAEEIGLCNTAQSDMENAYCTSKYEACSCCDRFFTCWNKEYAALEAAQAHAKVQIDLIIAQQTALECLLCYGAQIIEAGTPDFDSCDGGGCAGCSNFPYPDGSVTPKYDDTASCTSDVLTGNTLDFGIYTNPILSSNCEKTVTVSLFCNACDAFTACSASAYESD